VFNAAVFGAILRAGFEHPFTDRLSIRLEAFCRMNFSAASYGASSGSVPESFQRRTDHFTTVGSTLALSLTL
jgi:hypothetical protein